MAGFITFIEESYNELVQKVTWPTWAELQESTVLVFIATAIIGLLIFLMDFVFGVTSNPYWKGVVGFVYSFLTKSF